jgi:hypothetical protein
MTKRNIAHTIRTIVWTINIQPTQLRPKINLKPQSYVEVHVVSMSSFFATSYSTTQILPFTFIIRFYTLLLFLPI